MQQLISPRRKTLGAFERLKLAEQWPSLYRAYTRRWLTRFTFTRREMFRGGQKRRSEFHFVHFERGWSTKANPAANFERRKLRRAYFTSVTHNARSLHGRAPEYHFSFSFFFKILSRKEHRRYGIMWSCSLMCRVFIEFRVLTDFVENIHVQLEIKAFVRLVYCRNEEENIFYMIFKYIATLYSTIFCYI